MPWKLNFLGTNPLLKGTAVGDCWLDTEDLEQRIQNMGSAYYLQHNKHRPLCFVCLPDGTFFCVDSIASHDPSRKGWTVTGEPPNITVSPSIHIQSKRPDPNSHEEPRKWIDYSSYHGFIENGILKEDCDGPQKFAADTPYLDRTKNRIP